MLENACEEQSKGSGVLNSARRTQTADLGIFLQFYYYYCYIICYKLRLFCICNKNKCIIKHNYTHKRILMMYYQFLSSRLLLIDFSGCYALLVNQRFISGSFFKQKMGLKNKIALPKNEQLQTTQTEPVCFACPGSRLALHNYSLHSFSRLEPTCLGWAAPMPRWLPLFRTPKERCIAYYLELTTIFQFRFPI